MFYTRAILSRQWGVVTYVPSVHAPCVGGHYKSPLYVLSLSLSICRGHLIAGTRSGYISIHMESPRTSP